MAHSLPHNLKDLCHSEITTAHRHLSIYVHIVFIKFLCGLQRFVPAFIRLKPDTKRCKPYGATSTRPLKSRRPGVLHVILIGGLSLLPWVKYTHKTLFPVAHPEHSSTEQHSTMALRYPRCRLAAWFYDIFTKSLRNLYEIRIWQGSRARQQGSFLFFPSLLYDSLVSSAFQFNLFLYFFVCMFFYSTFLFYCSLDCVSQTIGNPSTWVSILKRICLKSICALAKC